MPRVPPTKLPKHPPPIPAGGVILNTPQVEVPQTQTLTTFYGCSIGFFVILDENDVCQGYKIVIQDPGNAHTYEAGIGQEMIEGWAQDFPKYPKIGERPDEVE